MSGGYSYTTITAGPDEPTRVGMSFRLDTSAWITVPGIDAGKPHLLISHGEVSARICPHSGSVTSLDARMAREVADKAAVYAAECERLAAANASADDAAGEPAA